MNFAFNPRDIQDYCTQDAFVLSHEWAVGDVVVRSDGNGIYSGFFPETTIENAKACRIAPFDKW